MNQAFGRAGVTRAAFAIVVGLSTGAVSAQTTGNYASGQSYYNGNCTGCHTVAKNRADITARAPAGLDFSKAVAALNSAINNDADLDGNVTGMRIMFMALTTTQRGDLAAYISNLTTPAPIVTSDVDFPQLGPVAVGATPATMRVNLTNTGTADLVFGSNGVATLATGADAADFSADGNDCATKMLRVGTTDTCFVRLTFTPRAGASATRSATLAITSNTAIPKLIVVTGVISGSPGSTTPPATTPPTTTPPTGSANAPSSGGGGAVNWQWLGLLLLALLASSRTNTIPRSLSTTNFGGRANKSDNKAYLPWQC